MDQSDILGLQIEALYKAAPASLLSIVGAAIGISVYWEPGLETVLLVWFVLVSGTALLHLASAALRRGGALADWTPQAWARLVGGIYLCSGTCWGLGTAFFVVAGDVQQAIVACCLLMGAITVSFPAAVYVPAYNLFQVPALGLVALGLAMSSLEYGVVLGGAALLLCAAMAVIAQGVGSQLVLALRLSEENRDLVERLEEVNRDLTVQSNTDPLTGVANRRRLMSFLRAATGPYGLLVVDVDHFKSYNDSFGHAEGDICLKLIAEALEAAVRPGHDLVARQGGEEFVVVLIGQSLAQAQASAESVRGGIETLKARHALELRRPVTVSIGLAWRGGASDKTLVELMDEADGAVYAAKRGGRNRVCLAERPPEGGARVA